MKILTPKEVHIPMACNLLVMVGMDTIAHCVVEVFVWF